MTGHVPIGRIAALLGVLAAGIVLARGTHEPRFRGVARGVEFANMRGDRFCKQGSAEIAVVRVDPSRVGVHVHHYSLEATKPLDILEWQHRTGALAVFNAGQYYPDWSYMGILVSKGRWVSHKPHPTYKAALVAGIMGGRRQARVLDLANEPVDPAGTAWAEVAQSFMLFDHGGTLRVKKTAAIAPRTIVAEDGDHRLLVITTEGSYTLYDMAQLLKDSPLRLTHAMSMDGGSEAQMCVRAGRFHYASFGQWNPDAANDDLRDALVPLPAVVTVGEE